MTYMTLALAVGVAGGSAVAAAQQGADAVPLRQAMQQALSTSRVVADAEYSLRVAQQQVREAWASALPDVTGSLSYSRNLLVQEIPLPAEFFGGASGDVILVRVGTDNTWQLGLSLTQPLFEYGVLVGIGAASRYRALEAERLRGTTQQVVTSVRQAYFAALLAESELRLLEESVERVRETRDETRALNRAGLTSEYDVLRLEVEFSNVATNLQRARNAVAARRRTLLVEMGYDPDEPIALEGRLEDVDLEALEANTAENMDLVVLAGVPAALESTLGELLQITAERRSDLRQLRANTLLEEARLKLEKGEFVPRVSLFGNYNVTVQDDGGINFFGDENSYSTKNAALGVRLEVPIFKGFRRFARVEQSQALVRQSETRLMRAQQTATNEVRTLFEAVDEARERAGSQRQAVGQAERGFEIAAAEYREGIGSQLQVTDAEEALREAQFNYARSIHDYLSARARLELAIGMVPDRPEDFPVRGS
jgi:outer membrane protein TolC